MKSIPSLVKRKERLEPIKGVVPDPYSLPSGCVFAPRCPYVMEICGKEEPPFVEVEGGHWAKCWLYA
jgi:oligopeptide/dipeptide ABC transporter ATP-binding protein